MVNYHIDMCVTHTVIPLVANLLEKLKLSRLTTNLEPKASQHALYYHIRVGSTSHELIYNKQAKRTVLVTLELSAFVWYAVTRDSDRRHALNYQQISSELGFQSVKVKKIKNIVEIIITIKALLKSKLNRKTGKHLFLRLPKILSCFLTFLCESHTESKFWSCSS